MASLEGKVALVTGASRGIGEAAARALSKAGAAVVLVARSRDRIESIADDIVREGGQALALTGDVSRWSDVAGAVETCRERFGQLDILVNNAGVIDPISPLAESDPEGWVHAFDINAKGVYFGLRAALPGMIGRGSGVVINISSGAATSPLDGWSHYCASKAAALMLTRCADREAPSGVRIVGLSPGTVATGMQKEIRASGINPVSQLDWSEHIPPEWPAQAIVWLCTDAAAEFAGGDVSLRDPDIRRRAGLTES